MAEISPSRFWLSILPNITKNNLRNDLGLEQYSKLIPELGRCFSLYLGPGHPQLNVGNINSS